MDSPFITLNIAFIGAGQVNFGGGEGPWNHSKRVEMLKTVNKGGVVTHINFKVVAIVDPWGERLQQVLDDRHKNSTDPSMWTDTQLFTDYMEMLEKIPKIDAVFIGVPPESHGSNRAGLDIELQCARRKIHCFVEKPLSCYPLSEVNEVARELDELVNKHKLVISVGYMFRYSAAVRKMKEIIAQYGTPRVFNARYNCAYTQIVKKEWWDNDKCGGPIVEQATHFCDLARYIVGEVDLDSVFAYGIHQADPLGKLNDQGANVVAFEETIPPERKTMRSTAAVWKFQSGALGTLTHGVLLHGGAYETELEVWGDGYRMALLEPYTKCKLSCRFPDSEEVKIFEFYNEDVYYEEDKVFFEAIVNGGDLKDIASPYADSIQTYRLTWKIRESSEKNRK